MKVFRRFIKGILLKGESSDPSDNLEGSVWVNSTDNKLKSYLNSAVRAMVSEDQAQTLSNKTIDSANNTLTVNADEATVSELETDNLKAGVMVTDVSTATADTEIPSALAVKTALEAQNEANEITYDNTTSGLTATDVQAAVDEVEGRLDTAESNITTNATNLSDHLSDAVDAHDASAISNVPAGNLAATDVQAALNELQGDIDTNATGLSDHLADAADAHDASAISNVPSGNLAATDVQAALNELQSDIDTRALDSDLTAHLNDTTDAHDASAISYDNATSGLTAIEVQAAIDEVEGRVDTLESAGSGDAWSDPVDSSIVPDSYAYDVGSSTTPFIAYYGNSYWLKSSSTTFGRIRANNTTLPSGNQAQVIMYAQDNRDLGLYTLDETGASDNSGAVRINSGNATGTTSDSGDIELYVGSATQTRGSIKFIDGSEGTVGHVWTQTAADGSGEWQAAAGGATTELDNLGTTAINADLNFPFGGGNTINLDNNVYITGRNSADSADRDLIKIGDASYGNSLVIGVDLLPAGNEVQSLGNGSFTWGQGNFNSLRVRDSGIEYASLNAVSTGFTTPSGRTIEGILLGGGVDTNFGILSYDTSGGSSNTGGIFIETGDNTGNGVGNTGELTLITGDKSAVGASNGDTGSITIATGNNNLTGTADSGSISISTGTVNGAGSGVRGSVSIDTDKLDVSAVSEGIGLPVWKKVTVGHAALQAASTTNDVELLSLPVAATIHAVIIKHTTAFAGTGITAYDVSIGIAGDLTKYASAFDVFQATGDTVAQTTNVVDVEDFGSATSIRIAATSAGANLDQSSAGSVDVYVLMSTLPV